ncbi:MAG: thioredoxin family protein [Anaerolineales bacterium]|nr:thioredoxin family protein [Anaerolineales bacterium]
MISIKVLGPGCKNCERVEIHAVQAVEQWQVENPGAEVTIEKVTDTEKFLDYGLLSTPGLVINEKLVTSGRIPAPFQIVAWLNEAAG